MRASSMHSIELYLNRANGKKALNQKETNNNNKNKTTTKIETFIRFNIAIMYDIKFYYYRRYGPSHSPFTFAVYPRLLSVAIVQKKPFFNSRHSHSRSRVLHIKWSHGCVMCILVWWKILQIFPYLFRVPCFEHPNWYSKWISIYSIFHRRWRCSAIDQQKLNPIAVSQVLHHKCALTQALALIRYWPSVNHWCRNQFQLRTTKIIWFYCNSTIKLQ